VNLREVVVVVVVVVVVMIINLNLLQNYSTPSILRRILLDCGTWKDQIQ